jgi:hypothetical protein
MNARATDFLRRVDPDEMYTHGVPMTFALLWASLCAESRAIMAKDASDEYRAILDALSDAYPPPGAEQASP